MVVPRAMGEAKALWASRTLHSACSCQVTPHSKPGRLDQGEASLAAVCWHFGPLELRISGPWGPDSGSWPPCTQTELCVLTEGAVWDVCTLQQE